MSRKVDKLAELLRAHDEDVLHQGRELAQSLPDKELEELLWSLGREFLHGGSLRDFPSEFLTIRLIWLQRLLDVPGGPSAPPR